MSRIYPTPIDERYANDNEFRTFVDHFRGLFRACQLTPADARTAVNYAAYLEEMARTHSYIYITETGELTHERARR